MERFAAEFRQFFEECTCYFVMQRKPEEGKYILNLNQSQVQHERVLFKASRHCGLYKESSNPVRQVQQLLLLPPAPGLSLLLELYYAISHPTLQRSISSMNYQFQHSQNLNRSLSSAPFKLSTEKGDRICGRYQNSNRTLTSERLICSKFSNSVLFLCGPDIIQVFVYNI